MEYFEKQYAQTSTLCVKDDMPYCMAKVWLEDDGKINFDYWFGREQITYFQIGNHFSDKDEIVKHLLEEFEKKKQEGLFAMMDKIHENSEELKEQIKTEEKREFFIERQKMEEYEKSFLFEEENAKVVL